MSAELNAHPHGEVTRASLAILIAMIILGFSDNLVILIADDIGLWQMHAVRGIFCILFLVGWAKWRGTSLRIMNWKPVLARSLLLTTSMLMFFGALPFVRVAIAGAGLFTSPIFVLFFGLIFFHEKIGIRRAIAVFTGSIGVVLVLDLGSASFTPMAIISVMAGAFYAANNLITRRYCAAEGTLALLLIYILAITGVGVFGVAFNSLANFDYGSSAELAYLLRGWSHFTWTQFGVMAIQGASTVTALALITWGYQRAETSYVAISEYSYLISGGVMGWLMWGDQLSANSFIGIIFIILAGAVIILRTPARKQKPA